MKNKSFSIRRLAVAAGLAAFSAVVQLVHIGYQSPQFGMWIDIVAVSWIITYLLYDFKMSLTVSAVGAVIITLFAPDTWLGAGMKFIASVPMFLLPAAWLLLLKKNLGHYSKAVNLILPTFTALIVRCIIVLPINYYFAIPIWTGMTVQLAMRTIPWYIIVAFNVVQGIIDIAAAWVLVYKFQLKRYSK